MYVCLDALNVSQMNLLGIVCEWELILLRSVENVERARQLTSSPPPPSSLPCKVVLRSSSRRKKMAVLEDLAEIMTMVSEADNEEEEDDEGYVCDLKEKSRQCHNETLYIIQSVCSGVNKL